MRIVEQIALAVALIVALDAPVFAADLSSDELDLLEVAFRHHFAHADTVRRERASAYYISVQGADPPQELLARFDGHKPPVRVGSAFVRVPIGEDPERSKGGVQFSIKVESRSSPTTVRVRADYYEDLLSSASYIYELKRENGAWRVISSELDWISEWLPKYWPYNNAMELTSLALASLHPLAAL